MCGSTFFGRLAARHQEHTTALGASLLTVGEKWLERCWSSRFSPTVKPEAPNALYAPDDGRGDARNMLSHT